MRTTLTIDDDILAAAKSLAEQQRRSVGEIISDLARNSLQKPQVGGERNGIQLLKATGARSVVNLDIVNRLRDDVP